MGLLGNLFSRDPAQQIARVESLLDSEQGYRALELAEKLARSSPAIAEQAAALAARARQLLVAAALDKASASEAAGAWEDAADWLLAASQHLRDDDRAAAVDARRRQLLDRADEERSPLASRSLTDGAASSSDGPFDDEVEGDDPYDTLCGTLAEWIAPRYEAAGPAFRNAVVALNEGAVTDARPVFQTLSEEDPSDPLSRLELGRCRLLEGDPEGAAADFEIAWEALGDEPLDAAGSHSVPGLWAEACLAAGHRDRVAARLLDLADLRTAPSELCFLYASAIEQREPEIALPYLDGSLRAFPSDPRFPLLLAGVLARLERSAEAIDCLEVSVAPSCRGGGCSLPGLFLPSLRALAALHLGPQGQPDRARELLAIIARVHHGRLGAEEHALLARYYEIVGNPDAAEHAAQEAVRLSALGPDSESPAPTLSADRGAVL